jgi:hypothetical protein
LDLPIQFDAGEFEYKGQRNGAHVWGDAKGDVVSLYYFGIPDYTVDISKISDVRFFYRAWRAMRA